MTKPSLSVVWFKRDLRLADHRPLYEAARQGRVLPLYIVEPALWREADMAARHWTLMRTALCDLSQAMGGRLVVRVGAAEDVLTALFDAHGPFTLRSHQETGNAWTHARDRRVVAWCRAVGIEWVEAMQFGVWRGKEIDRNQWAKRWDQMMAADRTPEPEGVDWLTPPSDALPTRLGQAEGGGGAIQTSTRSTALADLESFLTERGEGYRTDMSSPILGARGCSRLSVHLAAGTISMREAAQRTQARQAEVRGLAEKGRWPGALSSYIGRLHWHCHFMQKLESEPELEWRPMARAYEGMRRLDGREAMLEAFATGRTGYPFVDACLRSLITTGWINFRMRAMLMSFASYDLFLPWQESGRVLARLFTDYEPGIHWPQSQMQSGETGINTLRIYSPVKQGRDQDPEGAFVRQWVPELAALDAGAIHEPWKTGGVSGYPPPVVDHTAAAKAARDAIWAIRRTPEARQEAAAVQEKHGSRKRPNDRTPRRRPKKPPAPMPLFDA